MQHINQMSKDSFFKTIVNVRKAPLYTNVSSFSNHQTQS